MHPTWLRVNRFLQTLFNTRAAGVYILAFAIAIGVATFVENDFGTSSAQKVIYQAWWFELLLFLFCGSLVYNILKFRMIQQKKWALLIFHASMIVIIIGAGLTRYFGFEGMMHIREGQNSNTFMSRESYLQFTAEKGNQRYTFFEPTNFAALGNNNWQESYSLGGQEVEVEVLDFIANPQQSLIEDPNGVPALKMVIAGNQGREEYVLSQGQQKKIRSQVFNFGPELIPGAINIRYGDGQLMMHVPRTFQQTVMATQSRDTVPADGNLHPLVLRALYTDGLTSVVFPEFQAKGKSAIISTDPKVKRESIVGLKMAVRSGGQSEEIMVYGREGYPGQGVPVHLGNLHLTVQYGPRQKELPFALQLRRFEMEKYPGTNNAASYASEVTLIDKRAGLKENHRIYMNNILNYDGYRFFQSSFDKDEKGTYLSVNHDFWGTWVSYLGYALLTFGMIWSLISRKTRFHFLRQQIRKVRARREAMVIALLLAGASPLWAQTNATLPPMVSAKHAKAFSEVIVQDFNGRMKPMHTMTREVLRKIYRKESLGTYNADQVFLSMFAQPQAWYSVPLIKIGKHPELRDKLGVAGKYAAYKDFFNKDGSYKFREEMRTAQSRPPIDRGKFEKELLKLDERMNILSMIFSGHLMTVIPQPGAENNTWISRPRRNQGSSSEVAEKFFSAYQSGLQQAIGDGDYGLVNQVIKELKDYQRKESGEIIPSVQKVKAEIALNQSGVFGRLVGVYLLLGLSLLTGMFLSIFRPQMKLNRFFWILFSLVGAAFAFHTFGLGLRWYISGRAPWSNGYESMIYIAWTTTLAGVIFTRRSFGGLAATMVLAGTILFVATLSFLDPQITPLVPVLRSYWLTIHVSLEAGSYGFLMLGAIIGLINLVLIALMRESNQARIREMVREMSYLSEMTLTAGLFMISIGTYLGGVWANESWGRYWGWDAKETWALVTILVYAFILHMRIIPKLFGLFSYNVATIFGLASVIMTYYGVNYYLSGLHSYATGDPVPIPTWVYVAIGVIVLLVALAWRKKSRLRSTPR
ncbi:MAG: cytochrome c biogenesis protein CcsA [Bacteroidota bacterium]